MRSQNRIRTLFFFPANRLPSIARYRQ
jgi:hypothetical protein